MSQKQKILSHLKSNPKDFPFDEAESLLKTLGYKRLNKGKTSGSRVMFVNESTGSKIRLHKPHPGNILRSYQINQLLDHLTQEGHI